jgi:isopenicillin N synthase-like dioxygenase
MARSRAVGLTRRGRNRRAALRILATEDKPGGLQVCNAAGEWVDVPAIPPGCFIVNLGELMARWTNDAWVSTSHRVVNPPPDAGETPQRSNGPVP